MKLSESCGAILFDLDGTLTDPKVGNSNSVAYALERMGIPVGEPSALLRYIGPPLRQSFMRYHGLDEGGAERATSLYREYFSEKGIFENEVYPGIPELLGDLARPGTRLLVATSKPRVYAERIAERFGLARFFEAVEGCELDGTLGDKGELLAWMIRRRSLDASSSLMVGDREHDVLAAAKNRLRSVGVGYGYGGELELRSAGASYFAATVADLRSLLLGEDWRATSPSATPATSRSSGGPSGRKPGALRRSRRLG
jgi:phosphoglycolate phosphatase